MRLSRHLLVLALALGAPALGACSLTLNQDKNQCTVDADCAKLGANLTCATGVCAARSASNGGSSGSSGTGGSDVGGSSGSSAGGNGGSEAAGNGGSAGAAGANGGAGGMTGDAGKGGASGAPCSVPAPTCPDNLCVPFDNCTRLGLCDGAALPALVAPTKP